MIFSKKLMKRNFLVALILTLAAPMVWAHGDEHHEEASETSPSILADFMISGVTPEIKQECIRKLIDLEMNANGVKGLALTAVDMPFQIIENDKTYRFQATDEAGNLYNGKVVAYLGKIWHDHDLKTYCRKGKTFSYKPAKCQLTGCRVETFRLEMLISSRSGSEKY